MPYKFDIKYKSLKRHFEEDLYLEGPYSKKLSKGIVDTGATITLVDLEYALSLGAEIKRLESVVGVSMVPTFIYIVQLTVSVIHKAPNKKPLTYKKVRTLGALPYMHRGGKIKSVFLHMKKTVTKVPVPVILFTLGFPKVPQSQVTKLLSNLVCEKDQVVVEEKTLTGLGSPLLIGVDILKDLAEAGFPIDFEF